MLMKPMLFDDSRYLFAKHTSKSAINDRFYKGSVTAFYRFRRCEFYQGISLFSIIAEVHYRMLINIMEF